MTKNGFDPLGWVVSSFLHSWAGAETWRSIGPYIFNLVIERLANDIHSEVRGGWWKPITITRGGVGTSHLFFADDIMLFGEVTERQVKAMMDCLNRFGKASGLKVNQTKSQIFCSPNTSTGTKRDICGAASIPRTSSMGSYLGIPVLQKKSLEGHVCIGYWQDEEETSFLEI